MNILLIDDHALFREGFKLMLERCWDMPYHIVEVGTAEAGLEAVRHDTFDVIFLDMGLPGLGGMEGLRAFRRAQPTAALVVISAIEGSEIVRQALLLGAQGYIPKSADSETLRDALKRILDGEVYVPEVDTTPAGNAPRIEELLTPRQIEVLAEICAGRPNREIAEYLGMSDDTVRAHATALFRRLGVRSRTEALLLAKRRGWF